MRKETGILIAAGVGLLAVFGIMGFRKFLSWRHEEYDDYYSDFHRNFDERYSNDDLDGIEHM